MGFGNPFLFPDDWWPPESPNVVYPHPDPFRCILCHRWCQASAKRGETPDPATVLCPECWFDTQLTMAADQRDRIAYLHLEHEAAEEGIREHAPDEDCPRCRYVYDLDLGGRLP